MQSIQRLTVAMVATMAMFVAGCAQVAQVIATLPPVVIAPAAPAPPAPVAQATLAFEVLDSKTGAPVPSAFVSVDNQAEQPVDAQGYQAAVFDHGSYVVVVEADDYETQTLRVDLAANLQVPIKLRSLKVEPIVVIDIPVPPVAPILIPSAPVVPPPVIVAPACTGFECVRQTANTYARLLQINTFESCVEFTQRALELLGPDWGHVAKTRGESQSVPRGFTPQQVGPYWITGVSHDAVKHRVTGEVVDLLGNASANEPCTLADQSACWKPGPASIQWETVPPQYWRASNPYIPAVPVR